jgi:hypothetical protein
MTSARKANVRVTRPRTETAPPELIMVGSLVGVPLLLTAVRCTLQYIIVPFVLPLFGVQGVFSPIINIIAGGVGIAVILYNLKRLWNTSWRLRYLGLSVVFLSIILISFYFDYLALRAN